MSVDEAITDSAGGPKGLPGHERALAAFRECAPEPGSAKPDPILVADNVVRRFGGLTAVDVGHLEVQRGSITALIGPNGAGKTTLFNVLTGFDQRDSGTWWFNNLPLHGLAAHKVAKRGVVRTFQLTKALSRLKVIENMRLGATGQEGENFWLGLLPFVWMAQERKITQRADELLARFQLDAKREDFAGSLSGGQRKLLEMARALMVGPELVMLDEPMAGVNPALKQTLLQHVKTLREEGLTVLFVEHDMDMVHDISDWVVVMGLGEVIAEGTPDQVMANERVIDAYLGAHHDGSIKALDGTEVTADEVEAPELSSDQSVSPDGPSEPDSEER